MMEHSFPSDMSRMEVQTSTAHGDSSDTFLVSILTPTHNRAALLRRVWDGLRSQTSRHFEWIVADDGSSDSTEQLVRDVANQSDFPILYIRASQHVGKARMDNEAIRRARGEFILWCDSDDYLVPLAISKLTEAWNSIPPSSRHEYVGITALCTASGGVVANPFPGATRNDVTWNDLAEIHRVTSDMLFFVRSSALRAIPFPEVDLVIPESVVWTALGNQKTRLVPEALKVVEYQCEGGISFSGLMAYNRGRAHALAHSARNLRRYRRGSKTKWWRLITFLRYCKHGEIRLRDAMRLWEGNSSLVFLVLALPLAWLLAARDTAQGKVRKTHRQFMAAKDTAVISVTHLGRS